jgi:DNA polymerase I-like protein with 3'-5' exonuclease and polymerase domains
MTHRNPNVAQTPSINKPYGKECRECWTVPEGYKLVGIDASSLELRVLAHYMKNKEYINEIVNGDIHSTNQTLAGLGSRSQSKTFIFALIYGAGDAKIGSVVGGNAKAGAALRTRFIRNLPALGNLTSSVERAAQTRQHLKALDGRLIHIRKVYSSLNTLLQGGGAIIMKTALVLFYNRIKELELNAKFVANIHDEWQLEVIEEQAEQVGQLGVEAIQETARVLNLNCPLDGEYKIGDSWYDTH